MIRKVLAALLRKWAQRLDGPIEITIHNHLHLDGKQIAESVTRAQYERTIAMRAARQ